MDKPNIYSVKLKLNRHNLAFQLLDDQDSIQLGGTKNLTTQILAIVVMPVVLGLILLIFSFVTKSFGFLQPIGTVLLGYGSYGITIIKKKKTNNKNVKVIKDGQLEFISKGDKQIFSKELISEITTEINPLSQETLEGRIMVKDNNGKEHLILSINDKDKKLLEEDLNYIKDFINIKIGI